MESIDRLLEENPNLSQGVRILIQSLVCVGGPGISEWDRFRRTDAERCKNSVQKEQGMITEKDRSQLLRMAGNIAGGFAAQGVDATLETIAHSSALLALLTLQEMDKLIEKENAKCSPS